MTWRVNAACVALAFACLALPAQAETVALFEGRISFDLPPDFRAMTLDEVETVFGLDDMPSDHANYAAPDFELASVAFGRIDTENSWPAMHDFVQIFAVGFTIGLEDVSWVTREVDTIGGLDWARIEYTAVRDGRSEYWLVLAHPRGAEMYFVMCVATVPNRQEAEPLFDIMLDTLRLPN